MGNELAGALTLDLEDDHFTLRRGGTSLATLSFPEVLSLANAAPSWRQFILHSPQRAI
jgi:hypothetical protein